MGFHSSIRPLHERWPGKQPGPGYPGITPVPGYIEAAFTYHDFLPRQQNNSFKQLITERTGRLRLV